MRRIAVAFLFALLAGSLLLLGAPLVSSARAQARPDTTQGDSTGRRIEKIVVTGARSPATVGGAAAVIVSPAQLNVTPAPSLQEVLRQVPFVLVKQNSRGEMELSMRGSDSRQVAIMLDGLPLTLGWDHRADPSLVPATGIQSVKLVRGLSSLLYGSNVLGGIVELGLGRSDLGGPVERELVIGTGVDVNGATVASLVGGRTFALEGGGALSVRAGGGYRDRSGVALASGVSDVGGSTGKLRTNSQFTQYDGFAALRWEGKAGRYAGATMTGYSTERGVAPELHVEDPRYWRYPNQSRALALLSAGSGIVTTPLGTGTADASIGYNRGTVQITSFTDPTYSIVNGEERGDERLYNAHVRLSHSLPLGGTLKGAFTGGRVEYLETLGGAAPARYVQSLWSTGAEAEFPVAHRMLISGGLVNDASTTPESGGREPLGRLARWGWRAGMSMLAAGDRARVHASVSERSRFPALRELYSGALNRFEPNPDLEPETLLGTELGVSVAATTSATRTVNFQVVGFHHDLDNAVVRTTRPDRRFFRVNRDQVRTTGVELFGSWLPTQRGVSLSADLLLQHIQVRDKTIPNGDRRAEHQPEVRGGVEVGVPLAFMAMGLANARYTGTQYCLHPDLGQFQQLDAATVGNVALQRSWRLSKGGGMLSTLKATVALDNVADRAIYDQCGLPQPGRTLRFGVELR